jgi:leader peptidase (prepilin peptidase)/N-methyltransferase
VTTLEIFILIFGVTIGSFLNVVIYRVPLEKNIVTPRSACTACGHQICWYENIPILSWLFLRGKCSGCKISISFRYPLIELLTGLAAYSSYVYFYKFTTITGIQSVLVFLILCSLICHFFIDIKHQILPDGINLFLLTCSFTYSFMFLDIKSSLLGGAFGFAMPLFVTWAYYKLRGVIGLGGGDIKLFGILGLLFGIQGIVLNLFISCFTGACFSLILIGLGKMDKDKPIAFGPFIILTSVVQLIKPDIIARVYDLLLWS